MRPQRPSTVVLTEDEFASRYRVVPNPRRKVVGAPASTIDFQFDRDGADRDFIGRQDARLVEGVPDRVVEAASKARLRCDAGENGHFTVYAPKAAQGTDNTAQAEAMSELLRARGWDATVRYLLD